MQNLKKMNEDNNKKNINPKSPELFFSGTQWWIITYVRHFKQQQVPRYHNTIDPKTLYQKNWARSQTEIQI